VTAPEPSQLGRRIRGPLVISGVGCMGGDGTKHHARHFPKRRKVGKGRNLTGGLRLPHLLCCAQTLYLLPLRSSSPPSSRYNPPRASMVSNLPTSHLRSNNDLLRVRRLLGWQVTYYNGGIRCRIVPLANLQRDKIMLFTSYILARLVLLASSFSCH
jgi:hypothetical protein